MRVMTSSAAPQHWSTRAGIRPHDLLWVHAVTALRARPDANDPQGHADLLAKATWADADWLAGTPVVVRRDTGPAGWLPVGLRGRRRSERCAAWLPADAVARRLTPEDIAQAQAWREPPAALQVTAVAELAAAAPHLNAAGIRWGVVGSVGFALATGQPILRIDSDLDLIVRADDADAFARMVDVLRDVSTAGVAARTTADGSATDHGSNAPRRRMAADPVTPPTGSTSHRPRLRIDIQVDTPAGGFALAEWLRTGGPVLLKTACGPMLVDDPWAPTHHP